MAATRSGGTKITFAEDAAAAGGGAHKNNFSSSTKRAGGKARHQSVTFENSTSETGVLDFEELVDITTGRVFFYSASTNQTKWGLPLDPIVKTKDEQGWSVHVDPSTNRKYFTHEEKYKAQWQLPEVLEKYVKDCVYLQSKRSWAVQRQEKHDRLAPRLSKTQFVPPPSMRRMTLRMLVQTMTLDKIICDREAFRAFQIFSSTFHCEENVLFYCVVEAFQNRGTKALSVLGLDDLSKSTLKGLPRTQSHLNQITLDEKIAKRMNTTVERIQMIREATAIVDRFLAPNAPDWVCVDQNIAETVQNKLKAARLDPGAHNVRDIFQDAQRYVYRNLEHDLLPRFIKAALAPTPDGTNGANGRNGGEEDEEEGEDGFERHNNIDANGKFYPDEVLRHHLLQLQRKPQGLVTSLMSTANAFRSLFPSPRYAIEGRSGSGLAPNALTQFDQAETAGEVLASPTADTAAKSGMNISSLVTRPLSFRPFRATSVSSMNSAASAEGDNTASGTAGPTGNANNRKSNSERRSGRVPSGQAYRTGRATTHELVLGGKSITSDLSLSRGRGAGGNVIGVTEVDGDDSDEDEVEKSLSATIAAERRNSTGLNRKGSKTDLSEDLRLAEVASPKHRARSKSDGSLSANELLGAALDLDKEEFVIPT